MVLGCWWSSFFLSRRGRIIVLHEFVDVNVKFKELLSDKVLDKFIIVDKFLVINFSSALQLHFFWVILPLDLNLDEGETY